MAQYQRNHQAAQNNEKARKRQYNGENENEIINNGENEYPAMAKYNVAMYQRKR